MGEACTEPSSAKAEQRTTPLRGCDARHVRAIASTLRRADEAAQRGDHADALGWIEVIRAIGDELPDTYERKRRQWTLALRRARATAPGRAGSRADREAAG